MASINDNSALLLYRVGPVLCCAPSQPVNAIITPPPLTRTPGSRPGHPGIFKHAHTIITALDLRHQFGLDESQWVNPGRSIITTLDKQHIGFHVDEILDVISMPATGWGILPALLPRGIFTRTLLYKERIFLYAEFSQLQHIPHSGYLRQYIQHLLKSPPAETETVRPVPTTPISKPVVPSRSPAPGHTRGSVVKQAPVNTTPQADVAAKPESFRHRNLQPPATPTSKLPSTKETGGTKPAPATLRKPPRTVSRVSALPPRSTQTKLPGITSVVQREPPRPRPNTTTPKALQPSEQQSSPVPVRDNPRDSRPLPTQDNHSQPMMAILAVILLLIAIGGGIGIWYALSDDKQATDATEVSVLPSHASANTTATRPSLPPAAPQTATVEHTPPHAKAVATPPIATQTTHPDKPNPSSTTASIKPKAPGSVANHYHARIQKKAHEITITLDDVPAGDAGFHTTPAKPSPQKTRPNISAKADKPVTASPAATTTTSPHPRPHKAQNTVTQTIEIIHIVVKGDTLWDIAKRYVKDPFRYPELARLSKIKNPDLIYPGERVRIIKHKRQP